MVDEKGKPVERYKLTKEQVGFQKRFAKVQEARQFIKSRFGKLSEEVQTLRFMLQFVEDEATQLESPEEPLHDLPGMEFPPKVGGNKEQFMLRF